MDILKSQKIDLFDTLVLPIPHYLSQIWGYIDPDDIEIITLIMGEAEDTFYVADA